MLKKAKAGMNGFQLGRPIKDFCQPFRCFSINSLALFVSSMRVVDVTNGGTSFTREGFPIAMVIELCLPVCLERHQWKGVLHKLKRVVGCQRTHAGMNVDGTRHFS